MGEVVFGVNMCDVKRVREHNGVLMPICRFFSDSLLQQQSNLESWHGWEVVYCRKGETELVPLFACTSRLRPLTMFGTENLKLESFEFSLPFNSYQIMTFAKVDSHYSLISARTWTCQLFPQSLYSWGVFQWWVPVSVHSTEMMKDEGWQCTHTAAFN